MDYAILILLIYLTGSPYFVTFHYSFAVTMTFIVVFLYYIKRHFHKIRLNKTINLAIIFLFILLNMVIIINGETELQSYVAIGMQILIAYMIVLLFDFQKFKNMYINIISIIAFISLIFYSVLLVNPSMMLYFPQSPDTNSLVYHNAIVHLYSRALGFESFYPFLRNHSIFWEPGSYQAFLNLGILFLLESKNNSTEFLKKNLFCFVVLAIALVTTYSTTGFLIFLILLVFYWKQIKVLVGSNINKKLVVLPIFIVAMFFVSKGGIPLSYFIDKISNEFGEENSFVDRIYLDDLKLLFYNGYLNIFGISFSKYKEIGGQSANSIINTLVTLGTPFTTIIIIMYYKFSKLLSKKIVGFVILMMIFSTQSLIWRPLFLTLAMYGLYKPKF